VFGSPRLTAPEVFLSEPLKTETGNNSGEKFFLKIPGKINKLFEKYGYVGENVVFFVRAKSF
jgi:hypothetical protein